MLKIVRFLLFFLLFISEGYCNEVVAIKTYDRDSYIRIMFETTKKPKYFVEQKDKNKIQVKLPDTIIKSNLHKNIYKLNVIDDVVLLNENDGIKFIVLVNNNAKLMRYLYTEPSSVTKYYRVIVDICKNSDVVVKKQESIDNLISGLSVVNGKVNDGVVSVDDLIGRLGADDVVIKSAVSIEDLINNNIKEEKKETIDELINENVKAQNMNELLVLNNIINEEEVIKGFEEQNNEKIDMDEFLKSISVDLSSKVVKKDKKISKSVVKVAKYVVVVDAGHGGKDPGAIGLRRTKEKDINLIYAKAIKEELEKNGKIMVVLTRSNDRFVELKDRVNKARLLDADLFISVHSDSNTNRRAKGLSVYTLMKSASDTRTVKLMTQSNKYNIVGSFSYWKNKMKYDSIRYKTLAESTKFTNILIKNLKMKNVKMFGDPHKYGNFAVLLAPEFPSVLIELGFLSNPQDEQMLKSYSYRKTISQSVAKSVYGYFGI